MNRDTQDKYINRLAEHIARQQRLYYSGQAEISDAEFDRLWDELKQHAPAHPLLHKIGSETSAAKAHNRDDVSPDSDIVIPVPSAEKIEHIMFMHSQDKANDEDELRAWAKKRELYEFIAQHKLDGISIELQYEHGVFRNAVTRGDGIRGDVVTTNMLRAHGVPTRIDESFSGGVRGEVILPLATHAEHYAEYANCRNTTAGIVKRKDGAGAEHLRVICYDAEHRNTAHFQDSVELLQWLKNERFSVVEWRRCPNIEQVVRWHTEVSDKRATLPYEIDGIVVKALPILADDRRLPRPKYQIAYKFYRQEEETVLREVIWNQTSHQYTPIAITDPVQLSGTTVKRANLVNLRLIRKLNLHIGDTVAITKRGEIIPKIERCVRATEKPQPITPPEFCTNCSSPLIVEDTSVYCPNINCPQRARHQVRRWIEVLEIKDFGEVLIRDLHQCGRLHSIADLYRLRVSDIVALERQGQRSAEKALDNLHQVTSVSLATFIAALNIENIGRKTAQILIDSGYDSIDRLLSMTPDQIIDIDGIGAIMAEHICNSLNTNRENINRILEASNIRLYRQVNEKQLAGISFCFTGALENMDRKRATLAVEAAGGKVRSSVSAQLNYVVTNNPNANTAKLNQARAHKIAIINEEEFLRMLRQK